MGEGVEVAAAAVVGAACHPVGLACGRHAHHAAAAAVAEGTVNLEGHHLPSSRLAAAAEAALAEAGHTHSCYYRCRSTRLDAVAVVEVVVGTSDPGLGWCCSYHCHRHLGTWSYSHFLPTAAAVEGEGRTCCLHRLLHVAAAVVGAAAVHRTDRFLRPWALGYHRSHHHPDGCVGENDADEAQTGSCYCCYCRCHCHLPRSGCTLHPRLVHHCYLHLAAAAAVVVAAEEAAVDSEAAAAALPTLREPHHLLGSVWEASNGRGACGRAAGLSSSFFSLFLEGFSFVCATNTSLKGGCVAVSGDADLEGFIM